MAVAPGSGVGAGEARPSWYSRGPKRCLDLAVAVPLAVLLAPVMLVVTLAILAVMGPPVLFRQRRAGYLGRPFVIYKFRTMREGLGEDGRPLPDHERLTWLGSWLRRLSLDELPQLWNVVLGQMSLVGPRPLLMQYRPRYSPEQARRHLVRPGITGWAQVHGRNALTWQERFRLDVWYVDHVNFVTDLRVLWLTLLQVFRREGISSRGHATMPEFMGNNDVGDATGYEC